MLRRHKENLIEWVHGANPLVLLAIPFLLCGALVIFLLMTLPSEGTMRYFFFFGYFALTLFSRMCRAWESGIEVYHFLTFCFALTFGPVAGLLFTLATTVPTMIFVFFNSSPFFNLSFPGTLFQTIDLFLLTLAAGFLGKIAPNFVAANLVAVATAIIAVTFLIEKFVCNRVVGIDWGRLLAGYFIGVALSYNAFLFFGHRTLQLLVKYAR